MASMRVVRMEIPMNFTMEYLKSNYFFSLQPLIIIYSNPLVRGLPFLE
jgi:hypothetical protein